MARSRAKSPWQYKPWWCQPWSIWFSGSGAIAGSWLLFERWWLTAIVAVPIGTWMFFFLFLWPRLVALELEKFDASPSKTDAKAP